MRASSGPRIDPSAVKLFHYVKQHLWLKVVLALALLPVLLVLLVLLFDWNWIRPGIERYLSRTSQRSVRIADINIHFGPNLSPTVRLRGVQIENAPWAAARPMASVGEVSFVFDGLATVFDDRSVISKLVLIDADVDLERQADGLRNWRLRNPEDRGPGKYKVRSLEAHNSMLRFVNREINLDVSASAMPAPDMGAQAGAVLPTRIRFEGTYTGAAFSGDLLTGELLTMQETEQFFPVRGYAAAGNTRLDIDGRMADFFKLGAVDAQVKLAGPTLARLHPFVRASPPESHAYWAQGHLKVTQNEFALDGFSGKLGETDLAGSASVSRNSERRHWAADLRSDTARWADLRSLAGASENGGASKATPAATPSAAHVAKTGKDLAPASNQPGRLFSRQPWNIEPFNTNDAKLRLEVRQIAAPEIPALQSLRIAAELQNGALKVGLFDLGIAGGHATGQLALDGRQQPVAGSIHLALRNLRLEQLLARLPTGATSGLVAAQVNLNGRGESLAALLGSASGSVTANMAAGRISNLLDAKVSLNAGKIVWLKLRGDRDIAVNCAALAIDFRNGVGRSRSLLLDTEQTRTSGTATINLREEQFDLLLTPQAKQMRVFALGSAIHAQGSFSHAGYAIEKDTQPVTSGSTSCGAAPGQELAEASRANQ